MTKKSCILLFGALLLAGAHRSWAAPTQGPIESAFDRAWKAVVSGARATAKAGDWVIERTRDGAVIAYRAAEKGGERAIREADDAVILSVIKSRFAADPSLSSGAINVDVDSGVVTLNGRVRGADEAETAIRLALQTNGVHRVVSHLAWPGMPATRAP